MCAGGRVSSKPAESAKEKQINWLAGCGHPDPLHRLSSPSLGQMYCVTPATPSRTDPRDGTCPWIPPKGLTTFMIPPSLPPPARAFWTLFSQDPVMEQLYAWLGDALGKHLLKSTAVDLAIRRLGYVLGHLFLHRALLLLPLSYFFHSISIYSKPTMCQSQQ